MTFADEPLGKDTIRKIEKCAHNGLAALMSLEQNVDSHQAQVIAIDDLVCRWQQGEQTDVVEDAEDFRYTFGSLWGECLTKQFGWSWAKVDSGDWQETGVVSSDRSLLIFPFYFIRECLNYPEMDVTIALAFDMLLHDQIPAMEKNSYNDLMERVHRLIPKSI